MVRRIAILGLGLLMTGCQSLPLKLNSVPAPGFAISAAGQRCQLIEPLRAGQTIEIGQVSLALEGDELVVTYSTQAGWALKATHIHLAGSLEDVPQSGGGAPVNGQFLRQTSYDEPVSEATYRFAWADLPQNQFYVLTHAEAVPIDGGSSETAYGGSQNWPFGSRWAYYSTFTPCADEPDPSPSPSAEPTAEPTTEPTTEPTAEPTAEPSAEPSASATPDDDDDPVGDWVGGDEDGTPVASPSATPSPTPQVCDCPEPRSCEAHPNQRHQHQHAPKQVWKQGWQPPRPAQFRPRPPLRPVRPVMRPVWHEPVAVQVRYKVYVRETVYAPRPVYGPSQQKPVRNQAPYPSTCHQECQSRDHDH